MLMVHQRFYSMFNVARLGINARRTNVRIRVLSPASETGATIEAKLAALAYRAQLESARVSVLAFGTLA